MKWKRCRAKILQMSYLTGWCMKTPPSWHASLPPPYTLTMVTFIYSQDRWKSTMNPYSYKNPHRTTDLYFLVRNNHHQYSPHTPFNHAFRQDSFPATFRNEKYRGMRNHSWAPPTCSITTSISSPFSMPSSLGDCPSWRRSPSKRNLTLAMLSWIGR